MGHTHKYKFDFRKKNQVKSSSIWSRVPENGSDPPIGSDRESGRDRVHGYESRTVLRDETKMLRGASLACP